MYGIYNVWEPKWMEYKRSADTSPMVVKIGSDSFVNKIFKMNKQNDLFFISEKEFNQFYKLLQPFLLNRKQNEYHSHQKAILSVNKSFNSTENTLLLEST